MILRALVVMSLTVSAALAAEPPVSGSARGDDPSERLVTVTIPAPDGGNDGAVQALPEAVTTMLKSGWRISQTTSLGKTADGKCFILALVLDRPRQMGPMGQMGRADPGAFRAMPGMPPMMGMAPGMMRPGAAAGDEPGRADPVKASPARDVHVRWDDGSESHLEIGPAVGSRNPVTVTTNGSDGALEATYPATAFIDDQGTTHVDARGEPVSGPQSDGFSPDSFAIAADGAVTTMDDNGQTHHARVVDADAEQAPAPAREAKPRAHAKHEM